MYCSIAAVAAFVLGVAAVPAQQNVNEARSPQVTAAAVKDKRWSSWESVTWTTTTWGTVTWTEPVRPTVEPWPSTRESWQPTGGECQPAWSQPSPSPCMSSEEATVVANNFRDTIASPFSTPAAEAAFSPTFMDYSDSVIEIINGGCNGPLQLGTAEFSSLQQFVASQSTQQPIPFTILKIWNTCTSVHFLWDSVPGPGGPANPQQRVTGLIAIDAVPNTTPSASQPWLIQTVYSEFNSGAWLYDLGIFVPPNCTAA